MATKKINARKVWPRAQVSHLWAAQSPMQTEAREANGRTSYFDGPTLYSYGSHYIAGHFTTERDQDGRRVVLTSGDSFSSTTRKVTSARDDALRGLPLCVIETAPSEHLRGDDISGIDSRESWSEEDNARTRSRCADLLAEIAHDWSGYALKRYEAATRARDPGSISYKLREFSTGRETIERILALPIMAAHKSAAKRARAALATLPALVPHNPGEHTWASGGRSTRSGSWAELPDGSRVDLADWPKIARAALNESRALGVALDAIGNARSAAQEFRNMARAYKDDSRLALAANTAAQNARDAIEEATRKAKAAGVKLPARLPGADYYAQQMKRLNKAVARALVGSFARAMRDSAREAARCLARGRRYQGVRLSRVKAAHVRARVKEERRHNVPREWERLAAFNLEDTAAGVRRETARALDAGIANEPGTLADLRAIHDAHVTLCETMKRAANARDLRALQLDLDTLREYRADFDKLAAMGADELAQMPDGYGSPHNTVRNLRDSVERVRNACASLVTVPEYYAAQVYAVGDMPELPQAMRDAATLRDGYRMVSRVTEASDSVHAGMVSGQSVHAMRARLGTLGDALAAMRGDGFHGGLFDALRTAEHEARAKAETLRTAAHAYIDNWKAPTRESWIAGGALWDSASREAVALRLNSRGYVETSHGAQVPMEEARMLWRMVARCKRDGKAVHTPPPVRVGAFELRHIHANGDSQVGCHFIGYAAALEFATAQGWAGGVVPEYAL